MQSNPSQSAVHGKFRHLMFCFMPLLLFVLLGLGIYERGYWLLLPTVFLLGVVPFLDLITGWQDDREYEKTDFSRFELALLHWNTRFYAIFYIASVVYFAMTIR